MKFHFLFFIFLGISGVCKASDPAVNTSSLAPEQPSFRSEIIFPINSSSLTDTNRDHIRELVKAALETGRKIQKLEIDVWPDSEEDAFGVDSDQNKDLIEKRIQELKFFVKNELAIRNVDSRNMVKDHRASAVPFTSDKREPDRLESATDHTSRAILLVYLD